MKEKIINIKNVVKIMLMVIVIFSMAKSCANARVLTKEEVANFMLNAYGKWNEVTQTEIDNVNNLMAHWQTCADNTSSHEGYYSMGYSNRLKQFFFVYYTGGSTQLNTDGNTAWMYSTSGGRNYIGKYAYTGNGSLTYNITKYNISTNTYNEISQTNGSDNGNTEFGVSSGSALWLYTDKKLGASTGSGLAAHGQIPSGQDLFAENYISSIKWELNANSNNTITIPNRTETFYTLNKGTFTTTLATLQDSVYTEQIMMVIYAWNGTTWQIVTDRELFNIENAFISDTFPSQTEGDILKSQIEIKSRTIPTNVIIRISAYPQETWHNQLGITGIEQFYYITDSRTIINSGVLDITATFSGDTDYPDQVQQAITNEQTNTNDNNLQDVTNELKENNNWWKNTFNGLFTMSSGDVENLKDQMAEKLNISGEVISGDLIVLEKMQQTEPSDLILSWNAVQWQNATIIPSGDINFSQKVRENQALNETMRITRIIMAAALSWLVIHEYWRTFCITLGIGTELYEQYQDENTIVESQHQTIDTKTGRSTITTTYRKGNKTLTMK